MFNIFHSIVQKSAAVLVASVAATFGFIGQPNTVVITPRTPILILPAPTSTDSIQEISNATSVLITPLTKNPIMSTIRISALPPQSPKTEIKSTTEPSQPKPSPVPIAPAPKTFTPHLDLSGGFTPKLILDRTGFSVNQRMDGAYRLLLHTTTTASSGFDWDLSQTSIGGTAPIPKFDASFSCAPQPDMPPADSSDQNPSFSVSTSYNCVISLTDALLRKENKEISFQTGAGRLVVKASNLDTTLKFNKNTNGFVLDNQSAAPIALTGLTFDVSFTALNTSSPIVLRFIQPDNESTLAEYSLRDLPTDPARAHTSKNTDMKASFSFIVKPHSQRLLIVQVFGVQPLAIVGINPEVAVTLRQVSIDRSDINTALLSPVISWSCIPYDPNRAAQGLPTEQNCH